uniref:Uncharacterized protein n=1 Tax=Chromera velia CCMP2878 TaxID=1169474 RepID=A0A0K6S7Z7_9ALVE|eukprot:Cvel_4767.t1-p1 / transcript=Cvel_4767.t1 / gene=Cvel_4767 / organism=Chromera_velia_CCMP2878 / gene_product=hypothetical protein / transcript_product=hypothetical protein / location=Cvel_scaffold212:89640-90371(+) / protein_length=244 / sequence_SO=supercontig / SO=protein_coding / is_pseudo=false
MQPVLKELALEGVEKGHGDVFARFCAGIAAMGRGLRLNLRVDLKKSSNATLHRLRKLPAQVLRSLVRGGVMSFHWIPDLSLLVCHCLKGQQQTAQQLMLRIHPGISWEEVVSLAVSAALVGGCREVAQALWEWGDARAEERFGGGDGMRLVRFRASLRDGGLLSSVSYPPGEAAAREGNLAALQWLRSPELNPPVVFDEETFAAAVRDDQLQAVEAIAPHIHLHDPSQRMCHLAYMCNAWKVLK